MSEKVDIEDAIKDPTKWMDVRPSKVTHALQLQINHIEERKNRISTHNAYKQWRNEFLEWSSNPNVIHDSSVPPGFVNHENLALFVQYKTNLVQTTTNTTNTTSSEEDNDDDDTAQLNKPAWTKSTIVKFFAAMSDLYNFQYRVLDAYISQSRSDKYTIWKSMLQNPNDNHFAKTVKRGIDYKEAQRRNESFANPVEGLSLQDVMTDEQMLQFSDHLFKGACNKTTIFQTKTSFRNGAFWFLNTFGTRGQQPLSIMFGNLSAGFKDVNDNTMTHPSKLEILPISYNYSKVNQDGSVEWFAMMRHMDWRLCGPGFLVRYLIYFWDMAENPIIDFSKKEWYIRPVFPGNKKKERRNHIVDRAILKQLEEAFRELGFNDIASRMKHGRKYHAKKCMEHGNIDAVEAAHAQRRRVNSICHYLEDFIVRTILAVCGASSKDPYFIPRADVVVPQELSNHFLPWVFHQENSLRTRLTNGENTHFVQNGLTLCKTLRRFVDIFLQDSVFWIGKYPNHAQAKLIFDRCNRHAYNSFVSSMLHYCKTASEKFEDEKTIPLTKQILKDIFDSLMTQNLSKRIELNVNDPPPKRFCAVPVPVPNPAPTPTTMLPYGSRLTSIRTTQPSTPFPTTSSTTFPVSNLPPLPQTLTELFTYWWKGYRSSQNKVLPPMRTWPNAPKKSTMYQTFRKWRNAMKCIEEHMDVEINSEHEKQMYEYIQVLENKRIEKNIGLDTFLKHIQEFM